MATNVAIVIDDDYPEKKKRGIQYFHFFFSFLLFHCSFWLYILYFLFTQLFISFAYLFTYL